MEGLFYYIYNVRGSLSGFHTDINASEEGPGKVVAAGETLTMSCPVTLRLHSAWSLSS